MGPLGDGKECGWGEAMSIEVGGEVGPILKYNRCTC